MRLNSGVLHLPTAYPPMAPQFGQARESGECGPSRPVSDTSPQDPLEEPYLLASMLRTALGCGKGKQREHAGGGCAVKRTSNRGHRGEQWDTSPICRVLY